MFTVYTIPGCMFCKETVDTFKNRNINYKNIVVTTEKKKTSLIFTTLILFLTF